jgi:hypothetical protein
VISVNLIRASNLPRFTCVASWAKVLYTSCGDGATYELRPRCYMQFGAKLRSTVIGVTPLRSPLLEGVTMRKQVCLHRSMAMETRFDELLED